MKILTPPEVKSNLLPLQQLRMFRHFITTNQDVHSSVGQCFRNPTLPRSTCLENRGLRTVEILGGLQNRSLATLGKQTTSTHFGLMRPPPPGLGALPFPHRVVPLPPLIRLRCGLLPPLLSPNHGLGNQRLQCNRRLGTHGEVQTLALQHRLGPHLFRIKRDRLHLGQLPRPLLPWIQPRRVQRSVLRRHLVLGTLHGVSRALVNREVLPVVQCSLVCIGDLLFASRHERSKA